MDKICVKTFGCSLNYADSERIVAALKKKGFEIINNVEEATLVILNTCAVKGPSESKFFTLLEKLKEAHKPVVVAGCISQAMPEKLTEYSKIGPDQLDSIGEVVEETLSGNIVSILVAEKKNKLGIPKVRMNPLLEIIPICNGCLGACTFCITKNARGALFSHPIEEIVEAVRLAVRDGVKEIYLTSSDNGCYGFDNNTDLAELLRKVCEVEGDYKVRVGMANPNHILKYLKKLIDAFKHPKIYKFLHIPVQTGNNFILEDMNRGYQIEDYHHIINEFKKEIPDITISTDIIVGYPTETEAHFQDTIKLIKDTKPDVMNLSKFWPRPHTAAEKLKQLPGDVVKRRGMEATSAFDWVAFERNKRWKTWTGKVLMTEKGKEDSFIGRNLAYKQVIVFEEVELGKWYKVKINHITKHDLRGEIIKD